MQKSPLPTRIVNGLVVFEVPPDEPRVTNERVKELESEVVGNQEIDGLPE